MTAGVSVIMPVYNEAASIERVVASLLEQRMGGHPLEILAVDGGSVDGTAEKLMALQATDDRLRVVFNPHRTTPFALNLGLAHAAHDYVAILGAHCVYDPNYVQTCLSVLQGREEITGCSGRVIAVAANDGMMATLAHWVMSSRLGSSGKSFRTQPEGPADSIPYPVFRKQALRDLGGYNTRLTRNQDNDMNSRIVDSGGILLITWATSGVYKSPATLKALLRYAWRNGRWVAVSIRENPRSMKLRHLVPAAFVAGVVTFAVLGPLTLASVAIGTFVGVTPALVHLAAGSVEAMRDVRKGSDRRVVFAPLAAFGFHMTYGLGTLTGLVRPPG